VTGSDRLALSAPIDTPDVPTIEIASPTRRDEARSAMAVAAALRDSGVPVRDIAVAVRDLDPYEEPLFRAALQYGIAPVFWTQLRVTRTRPYALVESVCGAGRGHRGPRDTAASARTPVVAAGIGWFVGLSSPPAEWPIEPAAVHRARIMLPNGPRSIPEWIEVIDSTDGADDRIRRFAEWIAAAPPLEPVSVASLLGEVVEGYAERGLPETKVADSPALLDTETDARAIVRVRTLVRQLATTQVCRPS